MFDNIVGFIKYNGNNNYSVNNFGSLSNKISNVSRENNFKLNNIEDILNKFNYLIFQTNFSSKYLYLDELTGKKYSKEEIEGESDNESDNESINSYNTDNSDNKYNTKKTNNMNNDVNNNVNVSKEKELVKLVSKKIIGSDTFFFYPRGFIQFNIKNKLLYDCFEYQFHFNKCSIPIKYTNLNTKIKYKVKRTSGIIHDCNICDNYSIRLSKTTKKFVLENHFNYNNKNSKKNYYSDIYDLIKIVLVKDFLQLNDIDRININIPLLNQDNYNLNNSDISLELSKELIKYYNYEIKKYENKLNNIVNE